MKQLAYFAVLAACSSEPDTLDEVMQDVDPVRPAYDGKADGLAIDQLVALHCPGVVYADGVTTYRGITGTYRRFDAALASEPTKLVLVAQRDDPDAVGMFTGTHAPGLPFAGRFAAITDNPAIGAALSFDVGADGRWDEVHFVLGTRRAFGRVAALCLAGADRPFVMTRTLF